MHRNKYVYELRKDFIPFWHSQNAALFPRHGSGGCFYFLKVVLFMYLRKDMRYKLVLLFFPVMCVPFHNDHVVVKLLWVREVPNAIRWLKKSSKLNIISDQQTLFLCTPHLSPSKNIQALRSNHKWTTGSVAEKTDLVRASMFDCFLNLNRKMNDYLEEDFSMQSCYWQTEILLRFCSIMRSYEK